MAITLKPHSNESVPAVRLAQFDNSGALQDIGSSYPLIAIAVEHARIHEGRLFTGGKMWDSTAKVASGSTVDLLITTSASKRPHFVVVVESGGDAEIYVYENTVATGGTTCTMVNRNRNSATTCEAVVVHTPTVTSVGTLIDSSLLAGGGGKKSTGGDGGFGGEFVTAYSTAYLVRVKNTSGASQPMNIVAWLYE